MYNEKEIWDKTTRAKEMNSHKSEWQNDGVLMSRWYVL